MPSHRIMLLVSILLVFSLCWSVNAIPTEGTQSRGFVTKYITPAANLSLDKLVGRWYVAAAVPFDVPPNITAQICLVLDFHYDDNGTLVEEPITLLDGVRSSPHYTFPLSENGVWDTTYINVSGEEVLTTSNAALHVDQRFNVVAFCKNTSVKDCGAFVLVRHVADADRQGELQELFRLAASAGVNNAGGGFVKVIDPCRTVTTAAPDLSSQNRPPRPDTE